MNINLTDKNLTQKEKNEIEKLLKRENQNIRDDLEQMWYLMDLIWDDYGCDNKNLDWEKVGKFYSHPVWLLNGLFIEQHDVSMGHRHAISDWIIKNDFKNVVDYGGGFGTLARLIAQKNNHINMDIYEPYPSDFGLKRASEFENIRIIDKLGDDYDCLVATDVLEHVPDLLVNFAEMIKSVKLSGYLVIANNFQPVIKCHLPQVFHFRYTFNQLAKMMGLEVIGALKDSHATIFKKVEEKELNWKKIRFYERLSKITFPVIETLKPILRPIKRMVVK
ncbi:MAG: class I SAM-dependent methyltransferase [Flexistipes sinusarabici]|uniref:Class I SAM-dependent methyltransferase n=1 Tax=Flexistipes sinusarabici TaxID=2352 RepID=A0A5D0MP98_FLESI|nr:methyltransferase domain-containing protein [Flexistipes sinusarabici]TYB33443.1 MAG: class I SAM-dependent methyltransferase [Flexistipes sinusarabici]